MWYLFGNWNLVIGASFRVSVALLWFGGVMDRIALLAGSGQFPSLVAQEAKRQGASVVVFGIKGWADPSLASGVDAYEEIEVGALGHLIARLKTHGVRHAIMAGKVTKEILFQPPASFDADTLCVLQSLKDASVNALLGGIAQRLARDGITLLDSSVFLKSSLCPVGVLTNRTPSAMEQEDVRYGVQVARTMASMDVGQTILVKRQVVVAVEALEGTDAAIRRAHGLAGSGGVIVKVAASNQDRRFDLPVVGPETMKVLRETGAACLAVEAGVTLLLDRLSLIAEANQAAISLVGLTPSNSPKGI